jgi:deoxyribonuclease V
VIGALHRFFWCGHHPADPRPAEDGLSFFPSECAPMTSTSLACVDVAYGAAVACAGLLTFADWDDAKALGENVCRVPEAAEYQPGEFYLRELPALLALLETVTPLPRILVVDGYAWLGDRPGLGEHLHQALGRAVPVIGVAKNRFRNCGLPLLRGGSSRPLFISASGLSAEEARDNVAAMHGPFRVPTLLKAVDALVRASIAKPLLTPPEQRR